MAAWPLLVLFFFSGAAALVYEVLWMKELGLLFGNTAQAMATTLAAFFLGLAGGGYVWGERSAQLKNPLRVYALLELAVAVSVVGYFWILAGYRWLYPHVFAMFGGDSGAFTAVKFLLAVGILLPPTFFLGGTLPVMSQFLVRSREQLGLRVSRLYGVNTLGAAGGAFLAGFHFPVVLGFRNSFLLAMAVTVCVGVIALVLSRGRRESAGVATGRESAPSKGVAPVAIATLRWLAFLSGAVTLALQVLWTRMFSQVLQNSVYTFSVIVVVFLLFLAAGAALAHGLMRLRRPPALLFVLLMAGAVVTAATPFVFDLWTDGLHYIDSQRGWGDYVARVFLVAGGVMGPPLLFLGAVFPFLLKLAEPHDVGAGRVVGRLLALNTLGAIAGSLLAGFVVLDWLGLWAGIRLAAMVYLLAGLHLAAISRFREPLRTFVPFAAILLLVSVLDPSRLPAVRVDPVIDEEAVLEVFEDSAATVAVIRRGEHLKIKVNNYYTLGGTGSLELERLQGYLPVLLHPHPESVYMLGLGTGITAGATLGFPVRRLVVTELLPGVVKASEKYFGRYNNGLFYDPRATVLVEDGRNYLLGSAERFDVIGGDLFVPWKAGTGNLYSREHFEAVRERLRDGGVFMQWLPAYQLSFREFAVIARTLREVFPQVTVWRGDFSALRPVVGLLAQKTVTPLPADTLLFAMASAEEGKGEGEDIPLLTRYVGNLDAVKSEWVSMPVNSDDRPLIEFQAPVTQRLAKSGRVQWFAGDGWLAFMERLRKEASHQADPYLSELTPDQRGLPEAGLHLHKAQVLKQKGRLSAAKAEYARFRALVAPSGAAK